jgi:hypothetical protein
LAAVDFVTLLFLLEDLKLLPSLSSQNLVENYSQGGSELAVLMVVGAVAVGLVVWLF